MACIEATVVTGQEGLFDDPLFVDLKQISHEQLLTETIELMESLEWKELTKTDFKEIALLKNKMRGDLQKLVVLLGEIYRRNICHMYNHHLLSQLGMLNTFLEEDCCFFCKEKNVDYYIEIGTDRLFGKKVNKSNLICLPCKVKHSVKGSDETIQGVVVSLIGKDYLDTRQCTLFREIPFHLKGNLEYLKMSLQDMQTVKEIMVKILRTPLLTKQLEELMDEILDLNGNKISQMKDYLTPEEYRFVRSGSPFEEYPKQQEILANLKKMCDDLKSKN
jgi:hypothetical protein